MSDSANERLKKKPQFVSLRYEMESGVWKSLPFVLGVMGDFAGSADARLPLKDRKFITVDIDNFSDVMKRMNPTLRMRVPATMRSDGSQLAVELRFHSLEDFSPEGVIRQIEPLQVLWEARREAYPEVAEIDRALDAQLAAILHAPQFQRLEAAWRGLAYLVRGIQAGSDTQVRLLHCTRDELVADLTPAANLESTALFEKIYQCEWGMSGGSPYAAIIGDYEFTSSVEDVATLEVLSRLGDRAFAPFLLAAAPQLLGIDRWSRLSKYGLDALIEASNTPAWQALRKSDESRFVVLTMPRVLARLPYHKDEMAEEEDYQFEEVPWMASGELLPLPQEHHTWMSAAFVLGDRLAWSHATYGLATAICGVESGGKVTGLPMYGVADDEGCVSEVGPTDASIGGGRVDTELSQAGIAPLCWFRETDYCVFFSVETLQQPKKYDRPEATQNSAIRARLPCLLAIARFAHYLLSIAAHRLSFEDREACEESLKRWIADYRPASDGPLPLWEGTVKLKEFPPESGVYFIEVFMHPRLPLEELTTALRTVIPVPRWESPGR